MSPLPLTLRPLLEGFGLGLGLIVAIGAQNAHVLRMGLRHDRVFVTAAVSTLSDVSLIALGVAGMGALLGERPEALRWVTLGGALFLVVYGARAMWSAVRGNEALDAGVGGAGGPAEGNASATGLRDAVLMALGFSLLNPHVYLDTVVLLGGVGGRLPLPDRWLFAAGAMAGSVLWFFGLAFGAKRLAPVFARPGAWRVLDATIAVVMWALALGLVVRGA